MKKPEELFLDEKPGIRYHLILSVIHQLPKDTDKKIYEQTARNLIHHLLEQMRFAIELENAGKVNEAIEIYEKLVVDQIDDVHSYHRLFQYYSQIGRLEEVHRICAAYIEMTNALEAIGIVRKDLTSLRNVFEQYV